MFIHSFVCKPVYHYIFLLLLCQFDAAKLRKLRPSFKENGGSVTAGNASSIRLIYSQNLLNFFLCLFLLNCLFLDALVNYFLLQNTWSSTWFIGVVQCLLIIEDENALAYSDGAAALVLVSGEKALKLGLQVIAKITGYADAAQVHKTFKYGLHLQAIKIEKWKNHIGIHIICGVWYISSITLFSYDVDPYRNPSYLQQLRPLPSPKLSPMQGCRLHKLIFMKLMKPLR